MEAPKLRPTSDDRIKAAIWFAERGFGVFPCWSTTTSGRCRCPDGGSCSSPGKHPITGNGFKDATTDPNRIRTFLSAGSDPNYGLLPPDGVFVWDVDTDEERATLARLAETNGPLPLTLRTLTGKGEHRFWQWPDGLPRPLHKMFGLVTRWGTGKMQGYVIGPRSVHASGTEYTPAGDSWEILTLPEAWAKAAIAGESDTVRIGGPVDASTVAVGGRHDFLRNKARLYAGTVRDPDALFAAVWAENEKLSQPKSVDEVKRAIGDALTKFPADPVEADRETGEVTVAMGDGASLMTPKNDAELFPPAPREFAFDGLLGTMVGEMEEGTDASRVAMLASLVAFCGALMPAWSYFHGRQTTSPFIGLVGHSGIGRKGTAMFRARDALTQALGTAVVNNVRLDGLASGEALVRALFERSREPGSRTINGVLFEEEYAQYLAVQGRQGDTLDMRARAAFDGNQMAHRRANSNDTIIVPAPYYVTGLVAITPAELQMKLASVSLRSGSTNRWLWLPVMRREITVSGAEPLITRTTQSALLDAHEATIKDPPELRPGAGVPELLADYDKFLWAGSVGVEADLTRRFAVIAYRIAMVHASVERSREISRDHVMRALALTEYSRHGMKWTFGQALGDVLATYLLRQLEDEGSLAQSTISKYMIKDPQKRQAAVDELCRLGLAAVNKVKTGGRTRSELVLMAPKGDFRAFSAFSATEANASEPISAQKPDSRSDNRRISSAEVAQKGRVCPSCGRTHPVGTTCLQGGR